MKFKMGPVPEPDDFKPTAPWRKLDEPSADKIQLIGALVGMGVVVLLAVLWYWLTPVTGKLQVPPPWEMFSAIAVLIVVHEMVHGMVHPKAGLSNDSVYGVWLSKGVFYAMYLGEMSRNRYVAVFLAPFLIISVAPLVVCALWSIRSDLVMLVSLLNALFACVDLIGAWLLMTQLPSSAIARNKGWETWWREA
jgi:hypothetical protein